MNLFKSLATQVITRCQQEKWTLATAESCTGGLLADAITDIDGASKIFLGGAVVYSPQAKVKLCDVKESTIATYGTVSSQTTKEISDGIQQKLAASVAVAITGVAGGIVEDKPQGLVYISISSSKGKKLEEFHFKGSRRKIKEQAVQAAMNLLLQL